MEVVEGSLFRATINGPNRPFNQQLNSSRWPIYCDHSVTSADVRLSVGRKQYSVQRWREATLPAVGVRALPKHWIVRMVVCLYNSFFERTRYRICYQISFKPN